MNIHLKLRLGVIGALLLLAGIGLISQNRVKQSIKDAAWVWHTHEVLEEIQGLSAAMRMAQGDQQRYLLMRNPKIRDRFYEARHQALAHLARVRYLTSDNPRQQRRMEHLKPLLNQSLAMEEASIVSATGNREKAVLQYALASASDDQITQQIETSLGEMRHEEELLRQVRLQFSKASSSIAALFVSIGIALGLILIAFSGSWINRDLLRREQAERNLRQVQEGLETRVQERTADLSKTMTSLEAEMAERRKADEQLSQSEQRYRLLFEDSCLPIVVFNDETLKFLAVNAAAEALFGYTREEFLSMTALELLRPQDVPAATDFLNTVKTNGPRTDTFAVLCKDGKLITVESRVQSIDFDEGRAQISQMTDVTEQRRLEMQLRQSQKMEAVGSLAGEIANDFNNLLTVILGYSDSILRNLNNADPTGDRDKVAEIQRAGQRAAGLTRQLLAFSRKQILKPQVLELNAVVSNISQMLRRLLGEHIQISLHLDAGLGQVQADPTQLEQVLVNLAVNARDAMPKGGKLVIETHNIELDQYAATLQGVPPGRFVLLVVNDTGCGMDEQTKARVFEPFFTTKEVGKGTGLGLSTALGVVQQSGGTVTIYSEVGVGTTFKIYLPRSDSFALKTMEAVETKEAAVRSRATEHGTTVLLAEDEPSLRALASAVLRDAGYVVFEASNGKEALQVANDLPCMPALLLTDVIMPEVSGLELADKLLRKWPQLAVVYTSGYTDHVLLERNALLQDMHFLQKPYMPGSLLEQVASTIASQRKSSVLIVDDDEQILDQLRGSLETASPYS